MKNLNAISFWFVIIGGLNWLLVGLFNWDIGYIFGGHGSFVSKVLYLLIGISAVHLFFIHNKSCIKGEDCNPKDKLSELSKPLESKTKEKPVSSFTPENIPESKPEIL